MKTSSIVTRLIGGIVAMVLVGCANHYYIGVHHLQHPQGEEYFEAVMSRKADKELAEHEAKVIHSLVTGDSSAFFGCLSDSLKARLYRKGLADSLMRFVLDSGQSTGQYKKIKVRFLTGLDEAVFVNPFNYYDLVKATYALYGQKNLAVNLWFEKIEGDIKVAGIAVAKCQRGCENENMRSRFAVLYSRSVDRAHLSGRESAVVPSQ